jgi:ribose transport system ATP-binding protein
MVDENIVLKMKNITKTYPGVVALDNVTFELMKGEVLGLLGENGAGKSTLMKILNGIIQPDSGKIILNGQAVDIPNVNVARKLGISIIHQELNLIDSMDAAQNIFLGREPKHFGNIIDNRKMYAKTEELLRKLGVELDIRKPVKYLSVARRQMIEICKALSFDANIIVMDEPTAPLTHVEINELFSIIHSLKDKGVSIIYISHRLEEIPVICDRATVMRDGKYIGTDVVENLDRDRIIHMMAGRTLTELFPKVEAKIGKEILSVKNLNTSFLKNISFSLSCGEICALTGLVGAGRTEVVRALFGVDRIDSGEIYIKGNKTEIKSPASAIKNGLAYLTEDRKGQGFVPLMTVKENISLPNLKPIQKYTAILSNQEKEIANQYIASLRIKTPSLDQSVKFLSGGNQQKVVLAKWLNLDAQIIILDEPTRGIDIGAKAEIYTIIGEIAKSGKAVILISSEMEEVIAVSDRALVMKEGRIVGEIERRDFSREKLVSYAMGEVS